MKTKAGFIKCGPNEVLVISGGCRPKPNLVRGGGRVFVWPFLQKVQRLSLNPMSISLESPQILTKDAIPVSVTSIAAVKIEGRNKDNLTVATKNFAGRSEDEVATIARDVLEGHQRATIGSTRAEDILSDREKFARKITEAASSDLSRMGLTVISCSVKGIFDTNGFIEALNLKKKAELNRDLRIEEAEARLESVTSEARAEQDYASIINEHKMEIVQMDRDYLVRKHSIEGELNAKQAEVDAAAELVLMRNKHLVEEALIDCALLDAEKKLNSQEETLRRLMAESHQANNLVIAERDALEKIAQAECQEAIKEAEAEANAVKLMGEAAASAIYSLADAELGVLAAVVAEHGADNARNAPRQLEHRHENCIVTEAEKHQDSPALESVKDEKTDSDKLVCNISCETEKKAKSLEEQVVEGAEKEEKENVEASLPPLNDDNNNKNLCESACETDEDEDEFSEDDDASANVEDILDTITKVHVKVCEITGINLTNAILAAVFQEVLNLFK